MPKNLFRSYWKSIVICIAIFILSTVTFRTIPDVARFQNSDKITHILMYVGLGFVAYYEFVRDNIVKNKVRNWLLWMFVFFVFFGGIIEILQGTLFQPRTAEFVDWMADIVGLGFGLIVGILLFGIKK